MQGCITYYRWRTEFGGLNTDQMKRQKEQEKENERLQKAVSDLTLEKLILREAASGTGCTALPPDV